MKRPDIQTMPHAAERAEVMLIGGPLCGNPAKENAAPPIRYITSNDEPVRETTAPGSDCIRIGLLVQ